MEVFSSLVDAINNVLWSYVLIVVLVGCGIWLTLSTKFVQLRMLPEMLRVLTEGISSKGSGKEAISSFQAFCVSTASRVGVGDITCVSAPGAVYALDVLHGVVAHGVSAALDLLQQLGVACHVVSHHEKCGCRFHK